MAYAEKRGKLWRARWRGPDGTLQSKPGFKTRKRAKLASRSAVPVLDELLAEAGS